jgi:hypothetical protein
LNLVQRAGNTGARCPAAVGLSSIALIPDQGERITQI